MRTVRTLRAKVLVALTALLTASTAAAATAGDGPRVALLVTRGNGPETTLVLARPGQTLPAPVARLRHLPDAAVRGALITGRDAVAVVADDAPGRDRSWGSRLFLLAPGRDALPLVDRVAYAARPLVAGDGRIVVARGAAGVERRGELRVDALEVDEVDPDSGAVRTLYRGSGFTAFPAGFHGREVVIYLVAPEGARIVAIDRDTRRERIVVPALPPFARDFSVSPEGRLVFEGREAGLWTVENVSLASGERRRLHASLRGALAPHAWKSGDVTWNGDGGQGLAGTRRALAALDGPGLLEVVVTSPSGELAAAHLVRPGASAAEVVVLDGAGRVVGRILPPGATRLEIVGLLP